MKLLVHAPNWVGDAVLSLPALSSLAFGLPGKKIWVAARPWAREVFAGEDFIAGSISLPETLSARSLRRTADNIRKHKFDTGLMLTHSFGSALLFALAGIPARWGYARNGRRALLTRSVPFPSPVLRRHQLEFYRELIAHLGFPLQAPHLHMTVFPEEKKRAKEILSRRGINLEKPVVVLNPGAYYGPAKRWPSEYYARLSELLNQDKAQIVVTGSDAERPLAEAIREKMTRPPFIFTGETDIRLLAGILSLADLCVTNDSGPMHMANALKTPVIGLFGPTNPEVTRPFQPPSSFVQKKPVCWPCSYRECPFDHRCMKAVTPEEVFHLCREYLR